MGCAELTQASMSVLREGSDVSDHLTVRETVMRQQESDTKPDRARLSEAKRRLLQKYLRGEPEKERGERGLIYPRPPGNLYLYLSLSNRYGSMGKLRATSPSITKVSSLTGKARSMWLCWSDACLKLFDATRSGARRLKPQPASRSRLFTQLLACFRCR